MRRWQPVDAAANRLTVIKDDGKQVTYDPERLSGITAYREISPAAAIRAMTRGSVCDRMRR